MNFPKVFTTIEDINSIGDFARKYTWNLVFEDNNYVDVPMKFREWFPAESCSITTNAMETHEVQGGLLATAIPKSKQTRNLSITLFDTFNYEFNQWIYNWRARTITEHYVVPVVEACCKCNIICYDSAGKNIHYGIYYVFPTDTHQVQFDSSGDAMQFENEFIIAGTEHELFDDTREYR